MNRIQKSPQSKVDIALSQLSEEDLKTWNKMVRFNANYPDLKIWLEERGHNVSTVNISTWWITNRPRGEKAIALNALSQQYAGIDTTAITEMSLTMMAEFLAKLYETTYSDVEYTSPAERLYALNELLKNLASTSQGLIKLQQQENKKNLIETGKYELANQLKATFKDTQFEEPLNTALKELLT